MGYTHYWYRPQTLDQARFDTLGEDLKELLAALPAYSQSSGAHYNDTPLVILDPEITSEIISFDGQDEKGEPYCPFGFPRVLSEEELRIYPMKRLGVYQCIVTGRFPYDLVVCAALILARWHFPSITVKSDGDSADWDDAVRLIHTVFGDTRLNDYGGPWVAGWVGPDTDDDGVGAPKTKATQLGPKFSLGRVVSTPGALELMRRLDVSPETLLRKHLRGDWGDMDPEDALLNDLAVADGESRIHSAYILSPTEKIWIITEGDRSATTFLLPEDY
jgi:hypothetical protein